jgi:fibrillarin-like pre-rRNA processing protein
MSPFKNPFSEVPGVPGVYTSGSTLLTVNAAPGTKVYDEIILEFGGVQYRTWNAHRSKLAAMILLGGKDFGLDQKSRVLYLGAASGTTPSHVSDILTQGIVYCVEISQRVFRDLVRVTEARKNMIPIMGDASKPIDYAHMVEDVEFVYQDVAQRNQADMFVRNMQSFEAERGILMLKSRSVDVVKEPKSVYAEVRRHLTAHNLTVREVIDLDQYAKDHAAFIVEA